jgi:hypothetical protein
MVEIRRIVLRRLRLASVTRPLNSLLLPHHLIKWSSPVVKKQHFEVVFYPPASFPRSVVRSLSLFKTKKTGLFPVFFVLIGGAEEDRLAAPSACFGHSSTKFVAAAASSH